MAAVPETDDGAGVLVGAGVRANNRRGSARTKVASSSRESEGGRAITSVLVGSSKRSSVLTEIEAGGTGAENASGVSVGSFVVISVSVVSE